MVLGPFLVIYDKAGFFLKKTMLKMVRNDDPRRRIQLVDITFYLQTSLWLLNYIRISV